MENLKKVLKFTFDFTKQTSDSLSNGWQWTDAISFIDEIAQIPTVVKSLAGAKTELFSITPEQKADIDAFVKVEFDIPNDEVEEFVEDAISFVLALISLIDRFKKLKK